MPGAERGTIDAYALVVIVTLATCERHAQLIRDQHGADAAGAPISKIMEQARHARFETTRGYVREADAFRDNAAGYLGL